MAVFPECALTSYNREAIENATQEEVAAAEEQIRRICRQRGLPQSWEAFTS